MWPFTSYDPRLYYDLWTFHTLELVPICLSRLSEGPAMAAFLTHTAQYFPSSRYKVKAQLKRKLASVHSAMTSQQSTCRRSENSAYPTLSSLSVSVTTTRLSESTCLLCVKWSSSYRVLKSFYCQTGCQTPWVCGRPTRNYIAYWTKCLWQHDVAHIDILFQLTSGIILKSCT